MEVPVMLKQFKLHFIALILVAILSVVLAFLIYYLPSAVTILSYFLPLVLSTALFFAAVVVFGRISPPESEGPVEKTGTDLIDYVSAQPPPVEVHDTVDTDLQQTDLTLQTDLQ